MEKETKKILLVEDDQNFGAILKDYLTLNDFEVTLAKNGMEGFEKFKKDTYDLCILDVMMPYKDGYTLAKEIREKNKEIPLIFLTAKTMKEDVLKGYKVGADDYLIKPFSFAELLARVRIILRRGRQHGDGPTLCVADLEMDLLRRRVTRGGVRIDLTAKEFGLLELLMRRQGEVLPRSLIASQVWDMNFDSDTNVIEVAIRRLRVKIDEGQNMKLIQTVRGMGYVLEEPGRSAQ